MNDSRKLVKQMLETAIGIAQKETSGPFADSLMEKIKEPLERMVRFMDRWERHPKGQTIKVVVKNATTTSGYPEDPEPNVTTEEWVNILKARVENLKQRVVALEARPYYYYNPHTWWDSYRTYATTDLKSLPVERDLTPHITCKAADPGVPSVGDVEKITADVTAALEKK